MDECSGEKNAEKSLEIELMWLADGVVGNHEKEKDDFSVLTLVTCTWTDVWRMEGWKIELRGLL